MQETTNGRQSSDPSALKGARSEPSAWKSGPSAAEHEALKRKLAVEVELLKAKQSSDPALEGEADRRRAASTGGEGRRKRRRPASSRRRAAGAATWASGGRFVLSGLLKSGDAAGAASNGCGRSGGRV